MIEAFCPVCIGVGLSAVTAGYTGYTSKKETKDKRKGRKDSNIKLNICLCILAVMISSTLFIWYNMDCTECKL